MHKYRLVAKKGEGTFSEVLKAQSVVTGKFVAIKCMKNIFKSIEQVNSLREIQALRRLNSHANIIELEEVLYDKQTGRMALVFELMDCNIYEMIRGRKHYVKSHRVKVLMYQLIKAVAHMHKNGIFHRDIKPENILMLDNHLKVADFGSCRGIYTKAPYTEYISTRWYRAPECLLTNGYYDFKMDVWGIGCVFFEIVSLFPLFPGTNELDQIEKIHNVLGTPSREELDVFRRHSSHVNSFNFPPKEGTGIAPLIPHASPECLELIEMLLIYNPEKRITCKQALRHPYFRDLRDTVKSRSPDVAENHSTDGTSGRSSKLQKKKKKSQLQSSGPDKLPFIKTSTIDVVVHTTNKPPPKNSPKIKEETRVRKHRHSDGGGGAASKWQVNSGKVSPPPLDPLPNAKRRTEKKGSKSPVPSTTINLPYIGKYNVQLPDFGAASTEATQVNRASLTQLLHKNKYKKDTTAYQAPGEHSPRLKKAATKPRMKKRKAKVGPSPLLVDGLVSHSSSSSIKA